MSDWEYIEDQPIPSVPSIPPPSKSKWDDEDEVSSDSNSSVADAWDASDNEDDNDNDNEDNKPTLTTKSSTSTTTTTTTTTTTSQSNKPKKRSIKQAIADRQSKLQLKQQLLVDSMNSTPQVSEADEPIESESQRKARLQRQVEEEDAKHVEDLFSGVTIAPTSIDKPIPDRNLLTLTPKTKAEFDEYLELVMQRFAEFEKRMLYPLFVDQLARKLCERMTKLEDIRKVASSLNALANDRQRQEKELSKKGKKVNTKKQIRVDAGDDFDDPEAGAYYAGDYDDFM